MVLANPTHVTSCRRQNFHKELESRGLGAAAVHTHVNKFAIIALHISTYAC